jgi:acetyl-CoA carboxylase biotin carboxylase subunit
MFKKILIANRGEIAVRILRACKELGIPTVVVFSEADRESLPVKLADQAVCIGPPPGIKSYLNIPRIIAAAEIAGADAIHPGYGFLAENAYFADAVEACGITFIGPTYEAITKMGDKALARRTMAAAGVPITPGSEDGLIDPEKAVQIAATIGYPVIVKAVAGGGGRGMRIVWGEDSLFKAVTTASVEADAAFGNPKVYIEKYISNPRHIEFQLLADNFGNTVHLGERECSIQRRHQKLVEESPSPVVHGKQRTKIGAAAVDGAQAAGYRSAGTMEFLRDEAGHFYFMEMNTRIQVEHPVTEMVTGIDLVQEQIRLASGEKLGIDQKNIKFRGHAIECRINAEDPDRDFLPCPGKIEDLHLPKGEGVRVDTHIYAGYQIPPFYDSLVAKLIVWGADRAEAIARMSQALAEFKIDGIKTTIPFHQRVIGSELFATGDLSTSFIDRLMGEEQNKNSTLKP